jgi:hypothetical protein
MVCEGVGKVAGVRDGVGVGEVSAARRQDEHGNTGTVSESNAMLSMKTDEDIDRWLANLWVMSER